MHRMGRMGAQQVAARAVRGYWTTARGPGAAGGGAAGASERWRRELAAGPFAAGGQRRFLADEQKEEKKQEKPGMGVLATFMKSIREQMSARAESDEDLAAARERLELARQESLANAEKAMQKAKEAAEEASAATTRCARAGRGPTRLPELLVRPQVPRRVVCLPCSPTDALFLRRRRSALRCWRSRRVPRARWWAAR